MDKLAFVFAGQGAQHPGMGLSIYEAWSEARAVFDRLEALRSGLKELCFNSSAEELMQTANTQPAMFALECATAAVLDSVGIKADAAAGFSLGEMAALVYAGVLPLEEGFRLTLERGALMQEEAGKVDSAMSAVLKLSPEQVAEIASRFDGIWPVNYNSPFQTVVSGKAESMPAFEAAVKEAGGRAMRLAVAGGFHSPFMKEAARHFATLLEKTSFSTPRIPIYTNATGAVYGDDIRSTLMCQIDSPVRWVDEVRGMIASGVTTFLEIGPGQTLCGLIKKTDSAVRTFSAAEADGIKAIREAL